MKNPKSKSKAKSKAKSKSKKTYSLRKAPSTGGFYIKRRIPMFNIAASQTVAGSITQSSGGVLSLGTPVAAASGIGNMYDVPFGITLQLNQLDTYADLVNICDKYRIVNALIKFCATNTGPIQYGTFPMPYIEYVVDHDDGNAPTVSVLTQKMGVRNVGFNQRGQLSMYYKPLPSPAVYGSGVTVWAIVPSKSPYLNSANYDVPHYGIKGVIRNVFAAGTSTTASNFTVDISLTVHCKDLQ